MKKSTTKIVIILVCVITLIVGYYAYLSNRSKKAREEASMTVVQNTLARDLSLDYPATPKEVIKYYNEILRCFYNEECTDEEIEQLGQKAREMYDEELLEHNEYDLYMISLRGDIREYREKKRRITSFAVAASTSVDFKTIDGREFARIMCGYNIKGNNDNYPIKQVYLLRRDDGKRWKIYGWEDASLLDKTEE